MDEYFVISTLLVEREKLEPFRNSHLDFLQKLKDEGKLVLAGRFTDGKGGAYILRAGTLEEATEMAKRDPYHSQGLRSFVIRGWERRF